MKSPGAAVQGLTHPAAAAQARLNSMRRIATGLLVAMACVYGLAWFLSGPGSPWRFVAAFAEGALVGALADWFAVVALFRRPLGLPIWHTAVIPGRKDAIARALGAFVESHFVTTEAVVARVRSFGPAAHLARWMQAPENAEKMGSALGKALLAALPALDKSRLQSWLQHEVAQRLSHLPLAVPLADWGIELWGARKHQAVLTFALNEAARWLEGPAAEPTLGKALDQVLDNGLLSMFKAAATKRLHTALTAWVEAAREDPQHPVRLQFDDYVSHWLLRLKTDPQVGQRFSDLQAEAAHSPRLRRIVTALWNAAEARLMEDLADEHSVVARQIARACADGGRRLAEHEAGRAWIDDSVVALVTPLIERNRGKVAAFIQAQIDRWSKEELADRLELAVGRDLQFIRINGTLVGGLAGLAIFTFTRWF